MRALGSGWSFSDVAVAHDFLITPGALRGVLAMFSGGTTWGAVIAGIGVPGFTATPSSPALNGGAALLPAVASSDRRFVHVYAGTVLHDLIHILDRQGLDTTGTVQRPPWALATMGASSGQTIAGVISTSVHGADFDRPPVADMVRAIDLIAPDGTRHWFEPSSSPITSRAALAQAYAGDVPIDAFHYDDRDFDAALVAFGSMGVVISYILEAAPPVGVSQRWGRTTWRTLEPLLRDRTLFTSLPPWPGITEMSAHPDGATARSLEIFINPYRLSDDYSAYGAVDRGCYVISRAESSTVIDGPAATPGSLGLGDQFWDINTFKAHDATGVRGVIDAIMDPSRIRPNTTGFPIWWSVMDGGVSGSLPVISVELALHDRNGACYDLINQMLASFDALIADDPDAKLASFFALRFTQPSRATLAIQRFDGRDPADGVLVCHLELGTLDHVDGLGNRLYEHEDAVGRRSLADVESSSETHLRRFERLARSAGAHFHWGQYSYTAAHDPSVYAGFADWLDLRKRLTSNGTIRTFDNDFTSRHGISTIAAGWDLVCNALLPSSPMAHSSDDGTAARALPPTAFVDAQGFVEVLVTNADGNICWSRQTATDPFDVGWGWIDQALSDPTAVGSAPLPYRFMGRIAVAANAGDQHLEAFAFNGNDSKIYHAWRPVEARHWRGADSLPGDVARLPGSSIWTLLDGDQVFGSSPDVALCGDGNLVVVARGDDHRVFFRAQETVIFVRGWSSWSELAPLPGSTKLVGDPCLVGNLDGRLEVFCRAGDGSLWHSAQVEAKGGSHWRAWAQLAPADTVTADPAAVRDASGKLVVFAPSTRGQLVCARQDSAGTWPATNVAWTPLPVVPEGLGPARPAVAVQGDGLLVATRTADGRVACFSPNGETWNLALLRCDPIVATSAVSVVPRGRSEYALFVKCGGDLVQRTTYTVPPPTPLGVVAPMSLDFGTVLTDTPKTRMAHVHNQGGAPLEVGASIAAAGWTVTPAHAVVAPGATTMISVGCAPTAIGPASATLHLDVADTAPHARVVEIALSATVAVPPAFQVAPHELELIRPIVGPVVGVPSARFTITRPDASHDETFTVRTQSPCGVALAPPMRAHDLVPQLDAVIASGHASTTVYVGLVAAGASGTVTVVDSHGGAREIEITARGATIAR